MVHSHLYCIYPAYQNEPYIGLIFKQQDSITLFVSVHFAINLGKAFDSLNAESTLKPKSKIKYE